MGMSDEMSLPYLIFRTWRRYYDELDRAYGSALRGDFPLALAQFRQAVGHLLRSRALLLRRGLSPDDHRLSALDAAQAEDQALICALERGDPNLCQSIGHSLDRARSCRERAAQDL